MNSLPAAASTDFIKKLSLPESYCIFIVSNPNDIGKKDITPALYMSFSPDEAVIPILEKYSRKKINIRRIHFKRPGAYPGLLPAIDVRKKGKIKIFSLEQFAQRKKTPIPSPENAEAFQNLCTICGTNPSFRAILYTPN